MEREQQFVCPECGRAHIRSGRNIEGYITCYCGQALYVFGNRTINLTTKYAELQKPGVTERLEAFLKGTVYGKKESGRDLYAMLRQMSPEELIAIALEKYQTEITGEENLGVGDLQLICDYLSEGKKVMIQKIRPGLVLVTPKEHKPRDTQQINYLHLVNAADSEKGLADWQKPQTLKLAENTDQKPG